MSTNFKTCRDCLRSLSLTAYNRDRTRSDGYYPYCKECTAGRAAARRTQALETYRAKERAQYQRDPDRQRRRMRAHYQQHMAQRLHYAQSYYKQHKVRYNRRVVAYLKNHPEYRLARRARLQQARIDGSVTGHAVAQLLGTWTGVCPFCGKRAAPTIDHIVSLKAGGAHSIGNLQLMCQSCNSSKGAR